MGETNGTSLLDKGGCCSCSCKGCFSMSGGISPVATDSESILMLGAHNPFIRDSWELFQEENRRRLSKILPVGWLLVRWFGTTSGFYSLLSSSALSRCSELGLGRDTECSNSTAAFLALG